MELSPAKQPLCARNWGNMSAFTYDVCLIPGGRYRAWGGGHGADMMPSGKLGPGGGAYVRHHITPLSDRVPFVMHS